MWNQPGKTLVLPGKSTATRTGQQRLIFSFRQTLHFQNREGNAPGEHGGGNSNHETALPAKHG